MYFISFWIVITVGILIFMVKFIILSIVFLSVVSTF